MAEPRRLRFGLIGAGYWAPFQLSGWAELGRAECVAICDRELSKAQSLADRFAVPQAFADAEQMIRETELDFVDIAASPAAHPGLVRIAAANRRNVVCQKPLAGSLAEATSLVATCRQADVSLLVNENFRWQAPIRAAREVLAGGEVGEVFRARLQFVNSFPVFDNQPFLAKLERFILSDVGTHILDIARYLFGEPKSVYCRTRRVNARICGEDVATVVLGLPQGATVICELSYASRTEHERFPQTFALIEGTHGSLELATDFWLRVTTERGTMARRVPPPQYSWASPNHAVVHASIVDCQRNLFRQLAGEGPAETTGEDNLQTLRLVYSAYESAETGAVVTIT